MKRLSWLAAVFGFLMLDSMAASAQVAVVIGPRPVFVSRPPVVAVRPVAVYPAPLVAYRPVYRPVVAPRPYYPVARPVVVYSRPVFYAGPARRDFWRRERWERHERWEHRHGQW